MSMFRFPVSKIADSHLASRTTTLPNSKMTRNSLSYSDLADPAQLDKIDKLFACGVGDHIDLPQLVVVGDQSSGKSSVLEGLTNLPFPRDSGLCTRFATHITFRRSSTKSISVSVIPAGDASAEHKDTVRRWAKNDLHTLDAASFLSIMHEVSYTAGLFSDNY